MRGLCESLNASLPVLKRMRKDAMQGKFMQQKTLLEMSGHYQQAPLIQQVIAQIGTNKDKDEIDEEIARFYSQNITPKSDVIDVNVEDTTSNDKQPS